MRNIKRIDLIIDKIREIWKENPDYRFHQMLQNAGLESTRDNFHMQDSQIMETLDIEEDEF